MKISQDLKKYSSGSFFRACYNVFLNTNFQIIFWYRAANFLYKKHMGAISKIIMYFHKLTFAVDIDYRAEIGPGFKIVHGLGIVIGKDCVIEDNVTIYQHVVLGGNKDKKKLIMGQERSQPYIHSGATLYAGCMVFGPVEIGEHSEIGAGTIVTKDVLPNSVAYNGKELIQKEKS